MGYVLAAIIRRKKCMQVDKKELEEAISYFHTYEKNGWTCPILDDMTDVEIIGTYHECLAHEDVDLNFDEVK